MDGWMSMEQWWNGTDRGNWSAGRKTLYSVGGSLMDGYGAMVEWYWQLTTDVLRVYIYINLSQRHSEVSNKACAPLPQSFRGPIRKHTVTVQFTPKYRRPARSYDQNYLRPSELPIFLPLTLQTTTQFPDNYKHSPLSLVRQAVHRWHCYPSLQLTVGAISSSPILWDAVNKTNIPDKKKMGSSRSPRVRRYAMSFPHTYRTRGQLDVAIHVQLKTARRCTYVACVGEKPNSMRLTLWCPSETHKLPCSGFWRKWHKSVQNLMLH